MTTATFTRSNLPPFKPATRGHMLPKPGADVCACVAPAEARIMRPVTWGPGHDLTIKPGQWHLAVNASGDSYPNAEFETSYVRKTRVDPNADPRAAYLAGFWGHAGATVAVYLATKSYIPTVLGEVTDDCAGALFETTEGPVKLVQGSRILQSPVDPAFVWVNDPGYYAKSYVEQGRIFEGDQPAPASPEPSTT